MNDQDPKSAEIAELPPSETRRMISIYDLCTQPVSFGDFYMFQYGAYTLAKLIDISKIDFYILFDPSIRALDPNFHKFLEPDKHHFRALKLLPLLDLCPYLGSLSIIDSEQQMQRVLSSYTQPIELWPTIEQLNTRTYTYYQIISMVNMYKERFGNIPEIPLRSPQKEWIQNLFTVKLDRRIFVSVNIRKNDSIHLHRNSSIDQWAKFFEYCSEKYPVTFVILCEPHEIDPNLRKYSNVIYAKDLGSTADIDCSIVITSAFHMGSSSGPCAVAFFTNKPFFVSNMDCIHRLSHFNGMMRECEDGYLRTPFNGEFQRHINGNENFEILVNEFEAIWQSRDWKNWEPDLK